MGGLETPYTIYLSGRDFLWRNLPQLYDCRDFEGFFFVHLKFEMAASLAKYPRNCNTARAS